MIGRERTLHRFELYELEAMSFAAKRCAKYNAEISDGAPKDVHLAHHEIGLVAF